MSYYITFGDKTTTELGIDVLKEGSVIPGLPDTRDYIVDTPGRHGSYDFGADLGPRPFLFNCVFPAVLTPEDIEQAIEALNAHLLDLWGKPKTMDMELSWKPGKVYRVRYAGRQEVDATIAMSRRKFLLPIMALDPVAYGPQQDEVTTVTTSPASLDFNVESGLNVPITILIDNIGATTVAGFTFKTYETLLDWVAS